jgi:hypothetical protein
MNGCASLSLKLPDELLRKIACSAITFVLRERMVPPTLDPSEIRAGMRKLVLLSHINKLFRGAFSSWPWADMTWMDDEWDCNNWIEDVPFHFIPGGPIPPLTRLERKQNANMRPRSLGPDGLDEIQAKFHLEGPLAKDEIVKLGKNLELSGTSVSFMEKFLIMFCCVVVVTRHYSAGDNSQFLDAAIEANVESLPATRIWTAISVLLPARLQTIVLDLLTRSWTDDEWLRMPFRIFPTNLENKGRLSNMCLMSFLAQSCCLDAFRWFDEKCKQSSNNMVVLLKKEGALRTPLRQAVALGNIEIVKYLLDKSADKEHWMAEVRFEGCNCRLRGVSSVDEKHDHSGWEADVLLVAMFEAPPKKDREGLVKHLMSRKGVAYHHLEKCIEADFVTTNVFELIFRAIFAQQRRGDVAPFWNKAIELGRVNILRFLKEKLNGPPPSKSLESAAAVTKEGKDSMIKFLLETMQIIPTKDACVIAASKADADCLNALLTFAQRKSVLRKCLCRSEDSEGKASRGVLHVLCASKEQYKNLVKTFDVLRGMTVVTKDGKNPDTVVLDELSWFDEFGRTPIDLASDAFRNLLAGLFPADSIWTQFEIPESQLKKDCVINSGGGSGAPIEEFAYVDQCCKVAVKKYPKRKMEEIKRELGILSRLRFPFILRVFGWTLFKEDGVQEQQVGLVVELCSADLRTFLRVKAGAVDVKAKVLWARQIGSSLHFIHSQVPQITHGDVHLSNILLSSGHAVLCDFDFSCIEGNRTALQSKISVLSEYFHRSIYNAERNVAIDWLLFAFALFSVKSSVILLVLKN